MLTRRQRRPGAMEPGVIKPPNWEPRQSESLRQLPDLADVDMITITIGGNDANFSGVLQSCVIAPDRLAISGSEAPATPCHSFVPGGLVSLEERLVLVIRRLTQVARQASIFVLGYAPVTPKPTPCPVGVRACPELGNNQAIDDCKPLSARPVFAATVSSQNLPSWLRSIPLGSGPPIGRILDGMTSAPLAWTSGTTKIDHIEANYLWDRAIELNDTIRKASERAGAHFIDIATLNSHRYQRISFIGHDPCSSDAWLNGIVVDPAQLIANSGKTFHPNVSGHHAYAQILSGYITELTRSSVELSDAGLPVNPTPVP